VKIYLIGISILLVILGCDLIPEAKDPPVDEIVIVKNIIHQDTLLYKLDSLMNELNKTIDSSELLENSDTNKVNIISMNKEYILFHGKTEGSSVIKFQIGGKNIKSFLYFRIAVIPCPWESDCLGKCNGSAILDDCGVCNGNDDCACPGYPDGTIKDCNGECGGLAYLDECNVCDDDSSNDCVQDCSGDWGGNAVVDSCGYCDVDQSNNCEEANAVLVEVFTNVGCTPCVPVNHVLDEIMHDHNQDITMIRYHWNSPLPIDPMYDYNPADVELRRTMYSVLFCPVVVVNGVHILNGQGPVENNANSIVLSEIAQESDMYLGHTYDLSASGDSIIVDLEVRPFNTINDAVKIWAVVVEDSIEYAAFNGELIHMQVMRDLNSSTEFSSLIKDEMYKSQISLLKPENFSDENPFFHVITMVQSVEDNRVFQSNRLHAPLGN
jgi:hypothetical protein